MAVSQIIGLVVLIAAIGGSILFFALNPNSAEQQEVGCIAAVAALPLVNTTTGMGMSVAVAECD